MEGSNPSMVFSCKKNLPNKIINSSYRIEPSNFELGIII